MNHELNAGIRFAMISRHFKKYLDEAAAQHELTGVQLMLLSRLHHLESQGLCPVRQRDLEQALRLGHPTVTELLKKLEKKGFVQCAVCPSDRRSKMICSTEKAHGLRGELDRLDQAVFDRLCQGFHPAEQQLLLSMLDRLLDNACTEMRKDVCEENGI